MMVFLLNHQKGISISSLMFKQFTCGLMMKLKLYEKLNDKNFLQRWKPQKREQPFRILNYALYAQLINGSELALTTKLFQLLKLKMLQR